MEKYKGVFGSWYERFIPIITSSEFDKLGETIAKLRKIETVCPSRENVFRCFRETEVEKTCIVIWGMDPYPTEGVADGLAFSTSDDIATPKSLVKIHKAIEDDCYHGLKVEASNDLTYLAKQGVLLYNSSLTVAKGRPGSHQEHWEWFSNEFVDLLNNIDWPIHIIAMGAISAKFAKNINHSVHTIEHPAAAVYRGGIWNHDECFKKANEFLYKNYGPLTTIKW